MAPVEFFFTHAFFFAAGVCAGVCLAWVFFPPSK